VAVADPIEELDLEKYYYKGKGGRNVVAEEIDRHYKKEDSRFASKRYVDFREMLDKE
jgi:hypothetical protein